jgi:hypothetical protein
MIAIRMSAPQPHTCSAYGFLEHPNRYCGAPAKWEHYMKGPGSPEAILCGLLCDEHKKHFGEKTYTMGSGDSISFYLLPYLKCLTL